MKNKKLKRIAILIDAENIRASASLKKLLGRLRKVGKETIIRAYGDWTNVGLKEWKSVLDVLDICPVQQRNLVAGKNLADMKLIIEAMDILSAGRYDTFVIVTSDSDFTPLYQRLKEAGKTVIIVGDRDNVFPAIIESCDFYIDLSKGTCINIKPVENKQMKKLTRNLCGNDKKQKTSTKPETKTKKGENTTESTGDQESELLKRIREVCQQAPTKYNGGFVLESYIGLKLPKEIKAIYKGLGYDKFTDYLLSEPQNYEVKEEKGVWSVRIK